MRTVTSRRALDTRENDRRKGQKLKRPSAPPKRRDERRGINRSQMANSESLRRAPSRIARNFTVVRTPEGFTQRTSRSRTRMIAAPALASTREPQTPYDPLRTLPMSLAGLATRTIASCARRPPIMVAPRKTRELSTRWPALKMDRALYTIVLEKKVSRSKKKDKDLSPASPCSQRDVRLVQSCGREAKILIELAAGDGISLNSAQTMGSDLRVAEKSDLRVAERSDLRGAENTVRIGSRSHRHIVDSRRPDLAFCCGDETSRQDTT